MERRRKGLNYIHLLEGVHHKYRELSDRSVLRRRVSDPDEEPWPYYIKVFVKLRGGGNDEGPVPP